MPDITPIMRPLKAELEEEVAAILGFGAFTISDTGLAPPSRRRKRFADSKTS